MRSETSISFAPLECLTKAPRELNILTELIFSVPLTDILSETGFG